MPNPRILICSSEPRQRRSLVFVTQEEYDAYEADHQAVIDKHRAIIREKYGIWASNQNRFVQSESELNDFDSRHFV